MIQPRRVKLLQIALYSPTEGGFSIMEVLAAILLTTTFVAVALQGMVVAMLLKSKALQTSEATRWVQMDVESIRTKVTPAQIPFSLNQSRCHPTSLDTGFADILRDSLAGVDVTGAGEYNLAPVTAISRMGKTFQIARTLSIPTASENADAKVLGINYAVSPTNGASVDRAIFHFYTEVMPDVALQCQ